MTFSNVIPMKVGIRVKKIWISAYAGMTENKKGMTI